MIAINEIHISAPGTAEHNAVSLGRTRRTVAGWVVAQVSFGLDDGAAAGTTGRVANKPVPKQLPRDGFGRGFVERFGQRGEGSHSQFQFPDFESILETGMAAKPTEIWTIGHSTRKIEEFIALLNAQHIRVVADVRRFPGSRRHPQF